MLFAIPIATSVAPTGSTGIVASLRSLTAILLLTLCAGVTAQEPSRAARREIAHLFEHLEQSGCQFFRNGSWHEARKAAAHLRKKYVYLLARELSPNAEIFIERAATKSSVTDAAYRVRCAGNPDVPSAAWFSAELVRFRKAPN